jgi:hypothetical protein
MHERQTGPASSGDSPHAAARDLRAILASSGGGGAGSTPGITAQIEALVGWAGQAGFLDPGYYLTPSRVGGLEHRIWYDPEANRVVKITLPGQYGRCARLNPRATPDQLPDQVLRLGPATPLEYLDRMALHNDLFGDDVHVLGVVQDGDWFCLVISQPFLRGPRPSAERVESFLREQGFLRIGSELAYFRPADSLALFDSHPGNFVLTGNLPVPFDVIPQGVERHFARLLALWAE